VQYSLLKLSIFTLKLSIFTAVLLLNLVMALFIAYMYIENPSDHYLLKYLWMIPVYLLSFMPTIG